MLDAFSRDGTAERAAAAGARVESRAWNGFVDARAYALTQVRTPWTLMLDADERLDAEARAALAACDGADAGYTLRRVTMLCGRPVRTAGWSSERLLRFFRTERGRVAGDAVAAGADLHEKWIVDGSCGALAGTIVHDSYPTLRSYGEKFRRYTAIEAAALAPSPRALAREVLLAPLRIGWALLRYGGWRDGWRGLFVAWNSARYRVVVRALALRRAS